MSIIDKTPSVDKGKLVFEFELKHPPAKVWRALTEPALLEKWLLPVLGLKLEVGAAFKFQTQAYPGWDGSVNCEFLEIDAPRKLSFRWMVGDMEIDTVVTFTLTPTPVGTRLLLVQTGFTPENKQAFGGQRYGWRTMGEKLIALLEEEP